MNFRRPPSRLTAAHHRPSERLTIDPSPFPRFDIALFPDLFQIDPGPGIMNGRAESVKGFVEGVLPLRQTAASLHWCEGVATVLSLDRLLSDPAFKGFA